VNLREHVVWSHEPNDENTQTLAFNYMNMGIVKARTSYILELIILDINDNIMVVRGGVAGMNSALAAAKAGYNVIIA
jgi:quinone-modifying oxidoreductase, subunit QmoB